MTNISHSVAVSSASFAKSPQLVKELGDLPGLRITLNQSGRVFNAAELIAFCRDSAAEIVIVGTEPVGPALFAACPGIKLIAKYGVGLDNIDEACLQQRGVALGWTGGVNRRSVTELVIAFALGHIHNVIPSIVNMRRGAWIKDGGHQLTNLTVGLVGLGHVGTDLATVLKAFGCSVAYTDIVDKSAVAKPLGLTAMSYDDLIAASDLLSFHVPASPATHHMFTAAHIAKAKPNALIINTARGSVVDFDAVCSAVVAGRLGGFAADVFAIEPVNLSEWSDCPHLYFTPHIGGNTREAVLAMGRSAIDSVRSYLDR